MVGFDSQNKDTLNSLYRCQLCHRLLREPVQLVECGHRQCKSCTESLEGETFKCGTCGEQISKKQVRLDRGFKNDMKLIKIICSLCEWNGPYKDYEAHLNQMHPNPMCEYCGEKFNSVIELDEHKHKDCTKITVFCRLKDHGCSEPVCRVELQNHYMSDIHQKAITTALRSLGFRQSNEQHDQPSAMAADVRSIGSNSMITTATMRNVTLDTPIQELHETINILASGVQALKDDTQRLNNKSIRLQSSIQSLQISVEEQSGFIDSIIPNQEILQQDIASLKQKIDDMQYVSYDGTLIWRIKNIQEKMVDAKSERQTSIHSPAFYSSPTGYKMRVRLYLHGDGNARRTHMSLFFVLMRSEYDARLRFPFNYKVTFCLYDQTPDQRHIISSFCPDIRSSSFQRPRSEMNIASGIPKFFRLEMIRQENSPYVRDDAMFIKVIVEFDKMSASLRRYALSLNPGLPIHVQQMLIKQEAERRLREQEEERSMLNSKIGL